MEVVLRGLIPYHREARGICPGKMGDGEEGLGNGIVGEGSHPIPS
jgi:hypothetical protein